MLNQNTHINNLKKYPIWLLPEKSDSVAPVCMPLGKPKSGTFIMEEIWKDIKKFEGYYQISNFGRIRSLDRIVNCTNRKCFLTGKILSQKTTIWGYKFVTLCKNGILYNFTIHRLVVSAFIPNLELKREINHIDGNKKNNHLNNLEWVTSSENKKHAIMIGLRNDRGINSPASKLTMNDVMNIKQLYENGEISLRKIAKQFNVSYHIIWKVVNNVSYQN